MSKNLVCILVAILPAGCGSTSGAKIAPDAGPPPDGASPCADFNPDKNLYWGDLHSHTALSADAYDWGNRNFPIDAYRFASDPTTKLQIAAGALHPGPSVSIDRPLDFAAVTDHSEWLDATWGCGQSPAGVPFDNDSALFASAGCTKLRADRNVGVSVMLRDALAVVQSACNDGYEGDPACAALTQSAWQVEWQAAHDAYQRCKFTTLVGYEWTHSSSHQNVIFNSENVPSTPYDAYDYPTALDLWNALETGCTDAMSCTAITIPHNTNNSGGAAFDPPTGVDSVQQMAKYERLAEVYQSVGNSECYPGSGSADPTCAFEEYNPSAPPHAYIRTALGIGLSTFAQSRVNPLQLGIVADTDTHNGLPGYVQEVGWQGHHGSFDDSTAKRLQVGLESPGGITGVWATQNARQDIFDGLYRRETFGTSGPRIAVRFYQVWSGDNFCTGAFPGNAIAAGATPMGGTMPVPPSPGAVSQLVVSALKDQTDLAEVDIVMGNYVDGKLQESVERFTPSSPNTTWTGGSVCFGWRPPALSPTAPAYYYARVLETPTLRWSHYDCMVAPTTAGCQPGGNLDVTIQERAWTSPIWWLP